eukprot:Clim_evm2s250 gene=Clim_evmTU2s250
MPTSSAPLAERDTNISSNTSDIRPKQREAKIVRKTVAMHGARSFSPTSKMGAGVGPGLDDTRYSVASKKGALDDPDIFKIPELPAMGPSRELMRYYREKIKHMDSQRNDMLYELSRVHKSMTYLHKLEWENIRKSDEIRSLQKALSDAQTYLYEEREHCLLLYSENDRLRIKEYEDRKKIAELLALTNPNQGEITYFQKPNKPIFKRHDRTVPGQDLGARGYAVEKEPQRQESIESLRLEVTALKAQSEEQRRLFEEQKRALAEDRRLRQEEERVRALNDKDKLVGVTKRQQNAQQLLHQATRDLLKMRKALHETEQGFMEEKDALMAQLANLKHLQEHKKRIERAATAKVAEVRRSTKKESQHLLTHYQQQLVNLEEKAAAYEAQKEAVEDIYGRRISALEERNAKLKSRLGESERRRKAENEGHRQDVQGLRKALKNAERNMVKLAGAVDVDDIPELAGIVRAAEKRHQTRILEIQGGRRARAGGVGAVGDTAMPPLTPEGVAEEFNDRELDVLAEFAETTAKVNDIRGELRNLKAKMYDVENQLRQV